MAILVTGGLGYIGSHTVVELIQNNFDVVIIDDLSNTEKNVLDGIEKITGVRPVFYPFDLKRRELLTQVLEAHKIEDVFILLPIKQSVKARKNQLIIMKTIFSH